MTRSGQEDTTVLLIGTTRAFDTDIEMNKLEDSINLNRSESIGDGQEEAPASTGWVPAIFAATPVNADSPGVSGMTENRDFTAGFERIRFEIRILVSWKV
ncbi:hypothetical protein L1987_80649 [Smallanthus sonchifolius]|uniref:Uncharacterized protein n=1 Tax=Smallanthus sonchifolius TaxID=185202 RepID=A0ACB8YNN9_9ASTR|nr:hypothetical protein L1987_80649 [Smallanthus sonchifolius]